MRVDRSPKISLDQLTTTIIIFFLIKVQRHRSFELTRRRLCPRSGGNFESFEGDCFFSQRIISVVENFRVSLLIAVVLSCVIWCIDLTLCSFVLFFFYWNFWRSMVSAALHVLKIGTSLFTSYSRVIILFPTRYCFLFKLFMYFVGYFVRAIIKHLMKYHILLY